jgi:nicotinate-nucleotide pyrophosphorylase (carboxylating)
MALKEDLGTGDLSGSFFGNEECEWYIEAQAEGIVCGIALAASLFQDDASLSILATDGDLVQNKTKVLAGRGKVGSVLARERTALNFVMHLSGVATLTSQFVREIQGTGAHVTDTRKTLPGLRALQKYGVRCGGGKNHRMGLYDAVMLKDNHIRAAGGILPALERIRQTIGHLVKVEVECETLDMVQEAVEGGSDVVMLDNMPLDQMAEAVEQFGNRVVLEASGGISLSCAREIALTGVHLLSVGALTHSAPALAFHLELQ